MLNTKCLLAAALASLSALASAAAPTEVPQALRQEVRALLPDPAHRDIFCGVDGTEAGAAYSAALSLALEVVLERGYAPNVAEAIKLMRSAICEPPRS